MANRRVTVAGHALAAFLDDLRRDDAPTEVEVSSAPPSWVPIKPRLLAARDRLGSLPRFAGIPACAIGLEHREVPTFGPRNNARHPACRACAKRPVCSAPDTWNEELQPFRGGAAAELWGEFHRRLCAVAGVARDPLLDAMVTDHLACTATTARDLTLEPSVLVDRGVAPSVRLAVFHGLLPREPSAARAATLASLEGFASMQQRAFGVRHEQLLEQLRALAPFRAPVGFERARELLTKIYIEFDSEPAEHRKAVVSAILGAKPNVDLPFEDVQLLGVVSDGRALRSLKVYVRADPTKPFPGLAPLGATDPCVIHAAGRALAVLDLRDAKPPKWDLSVRRALLSGNNVARELALPAAVDELLRHNDFRTDCVAVGRRGNTHTLYLELS